jgi:hypothetical protein
VAYGWIPIEPLCGINLCEQFYELTIEVSNLLGVQRQSEEICTLDTKSPCFDVFKATKSHYPGLINPPP